MFVIYRKATGDVRLLMEGDAATATMNAASGEAVAEVAGSVGQYRGAQRFVNGALVAVPSAPPSAWEVPKLVVVERLVLAGKLRAARQALKLGVPDDDLTDDELALRDRWEAARVIASGDQDARSLFTAIGADPNVILAPSS